MLPEPIGIAMQVTEVFERLGTTVPNAPEFPWNSA